MNTPLSRDLSAAIIADHHALAAQHRLVRMVRMVQTGDRPSESASRTPAQRRLRLRRVTA